MPESLFNKACNFIQKETLVQVYSCEFRDISKNTSRLLLYKGNLKITCTLDFLHKRKDGIASNTLQDCVTLVQ